MTRRGFPATTPVCRERSERTSPTRKPKRRPTTPQTLQFHQWDHRQARLQVRHPPRLRRLLPSLAETGRQTHITVIPKASRYLGIDGQQPADAHRRLRRDTVDAIVWDAAGEAEALLLVRSLCMKSEPEPAFEQGWLLAEMEENLGHGIDALARRFDRCPTGVARRLALAETLSESIQQFDLPISCRLPATRFTK